MLYVISGIIAAQFLSKVSYLKHSLPKFTIAIIDQL